MIHPVYNDSLVYKLSNDIMKFCNDKARKECEQNNVPIEYPIKTVWMSNQPKSDLEHPSLTLYRMNWGFKRNKTKMETYIRLVYTVNPTNYTLIPGLINWMAYAIRDFLIEIHCKEEYDCSPYSYRLALVDDRLSSGIAMLNGATLPALTGTLRFED